MTPSIDRVEITLCITAALLADAAEAERLAMITDAALTPLQELGSAVLRAVERERAYALRSEEMYTLAWTGGTQPGRVYTQAQDMPLITEDPLRAPRLPQDAPLPPGATPKSSQAEKVTLEAPSTQNEHRSTGWRP